MAPTCSTKKPHHVIRAASTAASRQPSNCSTSLSRQAEMIAIWKTTMPTTLTIVVGGTAYRIEEYLALFACDITSARSAADTTILRAKAAHRRSMELGMTSPLLHRRGCDASRNSMRLGRHAHHRALPESYEATRVLSAGTA
jgi:hypothetical protein